ncbi:MAG: prepilin-type N-terminal cleavage/methylation domain-containing protein [Akkermansiaceae bacterium]|nr:prepilin-type N-terminal cleavage/methylation domain-containing protein [Armatimonadota bacterium]
MRSSDKNIKRSVRAIRGITLLEILVAATLTVILLSALSYAFVAGVDLERRQNGRRAESNRQEILQTRLSEMIRGAKLGADETDLLTYFQGESTGDENTELGCDRLTFTTAAPAVPLSALASTDDFETQAQARGPLGGVAEVSLGMTAVGQVPDDRAGLFERVQRPSDGDPSQGGIETLLTADVAEIGFQFWDGSQWAINWNTTAGERRLPSAVKVSYILRSGGDGEDSPSDESIRSFVVPVPASDVDAQNPASAATTAAGAATL